MEGLSSFNNKIKATNKGEAIAIFNCQVNSGSCTDRRMEGQTDRMIAGQKKNINISLARLKKVNF